MKHPDKRWKRKNVRERITNRSSGNRKCKRCSKRITLGKISIKVKKAVFFILFLILLFNRYWKDRLGCYRRILLVSGSPSSLSLIMKDKQNMVLPLRSVKHIRVSLSDGYLTVRSPSLTNPHPIIRWALYSYSKHLYLMNLFLI